MFIRRKRNRSGTTSIVIVDKSGGKFKEVKHFGTASDEDVIKALYAKARNWIQHYGGQLTFNFTDSFEQESESTETLNVVSRIDNILHNGPQLLLEQIYNSIGFNKIEDDILKHLVIARICEPMSKSATVAYLKSYFDEEVELHKIYRYMDKLYSSQQEIVQQISVEHTRKILGGQIGLMFYDVTTLYFETSLQDELRKPGFSKDGKTSESQIVLGLLVSAMGYPLSYSIFTGDQYEGRTMLPVIVDFVERFSLEEFIIVADSGLMSHKNVKLLDDAGYKYIIGARIKNESSDIKQWILAQDKIEQQYSECKKDKNTRLILSYSQKRAKKDEYNRNKGISRLQKAYKSGKITKEHINKRGYNKFLKISDNVDVQICSHKILEDAQWDGLKGYITNTVLKNKDVVDHYNGLWVVERAFRISKGTMEMRPMFHFTERRIQAHVCICFIAYKVYKELERIIKMAGIELSVDAVLAIVKTITTIKIKQPHNENIFTQTLFLTEEQKSIEPLFNKLNSLLGDA